MLFSLFFIACNQKDNNDKISSVHELKSTHLNFNELPVGIFLGRPSQILVKDSLFFITDRIDEKLISVFDVKKNKLVKRIFSVGQGPNDLLWPITTKIENNILSIFERQNGRYREYEVQGLLIKDSISCIRQIIFENSDRIVETSEGFVCSGFYNEGIFCLFNDTGKVINYLDPFEGKLDNFKVPDRFKIGQGVFTFNKNTNILTIATYFTGDIFIYKFNNDNSIQKKHITIGGKSLEDINSAIYFNDNTIYHSYDICSAGNYTYILYMGLMIKDREKNSKRYILQFDNIGNLKEVYNVDIPIESFCVNNNYIYAISLTPNGEYAIFKSSISVN